jgi:hypothetical protein
VDDGKLGEPEILQRGAHGRGDGRCSGPLELGA